MKTKVGVIAKVSMGYSFRSRLEREKDGKVSVIQMKDLSDNGRVEVGGLVKVDMSDLKERHRVEINDVVFRSRGQTNTAALVDKEVGVAVIAAPLLRIRTHDEKVLPRYLCWFINQPVAQARLASHAKGTAVRMISKKALDNLEVIVPPLERQHRIVELATLAADEQRLMKELAVKRKQYMERILMQIASGSQ